jgi:hypothetical protein
MAATTRRVTRLASRTVAALLLCGAFVGLQAAGAQTTATTQPTAAASERWSVQPSGPNGPGGRDWFTFQLKPGETFGDTVGVSNLSDHAISFLLYTRDASNTPGDGAYTAQEEAAAPVDVGSWIRLGTQAYTVGPGLRADIPFAITVPRDAQPGDHAGAILAINAADAVVDPNASKDLGFKVRQRVGARVYVRVAGPLAPAFHVDQLHVDYRNPLLPFVSGGGRATIKWKVRNSGNTRLTGKPSLVVKGVLGRTVKKIHLDDFPELLPGGTLVGTSKVSGLPPLERLTVELAVTTDDNVRTRRATSFWAVPWLAVVIAFAAASSWWIRRRRRRRDQAPPPASPRERIPAPV